jgi:colanic acid biosynthesis glycosyl transferase WcaI
MGNIGHSQGLADVVAALEESEILLRADAVLRIAGQGAASDGVKRTIKSNRVEMLGLLMGEAMESELRSTTLGLVTQRSDIVEFNLPSKLMNYMAHSLPVLAVVNPASDCARIVEEAGAGWVLDSGRLDRLPTVLRTILADRSELTARGVAAHAYAAANFDPERVAEHYDHELQTALGLAA